VIKHYIALIDINKKKRTKKQKTYLDVNVHECESVYGHCRRALCEIVEMWSVRQPLDIDFRGKTF
jgi:hypothetical protein